MNGIHEKIEILARESQRIALYAAGAACKVGNQEVQEVQEKCMEVAEVAKEVLDGLNAIGGVDLAEIANAKYGDNP